MRISRMLPGLLILPVGMIGCSQTWGVRSNPADGVRTVASVGDRPLPIRSGTADSSVQAEEPEPLVPASSRVRISGRVYDDRGKPVPGAKVRLAVGGEPGGKALVATTDPSGAFTLRGLRTGSSYTLIAEYQGQGGAMMTGRLDTEAPDTNVRISLKRRADEPADDSRTSVRPARPGVAPISNIEEVDDAQDPQDSSPRANREDIEPPAPEAEEAYSDSEGKAPTRLSAAGETGARSSGWTHSHQSGSGSGTGQGGKTRPRPAEDSLPGTSDAQDSSRGDVDEVNPLPPALDPEPVGSRDDRDTGGPGGTAAGRQFVKLAVRPASSPPSESSSEAHGDDRFVEAAPAPRPLPRGVVPGARSTRSKPDAPIMMSAPAPALVPGGFLLAADRRPLDAPQTGASLSRKQPAAPDAKSSQTRPTWGELVFEKKPVPLDESIQKVSRTQAVQALQQARNGKTTAPAANAPAVPAAVPDRSAVTCQFDPVERTLKDFQLPDPQGKMVAFHDLDSDLVLLDFWGTWCAPCRKSIPHLNEIQKTLGGKKVQVIGIACERTPVKDRAAKVARTVRDLKIQYPVLITSMDGKCPVQEAFQIQFYPTMVLLDRQGRILWREQGATDVTLARMDRFILKNLRRSSAGVDTMQARASASRDDAIRR